MQLGKMPPHGNSHFLGWAAHRGGGGLSVRDNALCTDLLVRKREILAGAVAASAVVSGRPRLTVDPATCPMLLLQATPSLSLEGAILQADTVVSELRAVPGEAREGREPLRPSHCAVRLPIHIQNISRLGGLHLYKHFQPNVVFPQNEQRQHEILDISSKLVCGEPRFLPASLRAALSRARALQMQATHHAYQEGVQSIQHTVDGMLKDQRNLAHFMQFAASFKARYLDPGCLDGH